MNRKVAFALVLLVGAAVAAAPGSGAPPSRADVCGKYLSQSRPGCYLEIRKDGTFYEKSDPDASGTWELEGDQVRFMLPIGIGFTRTLRGNEFVDPGGEVWVKEAKAGAPSSRVEQPSISDQAAGKPEGESSTPIKQTYVKVANVSAAELEVLGAGIEAFLQAHLKDAEVRKVANYRAQSLAMEARLIGNQFKGLQGWAARKYAGVGLVGANPPEDVIELPVDDQVTILALSQTASELSAVFGPAGVLATEILTTAAERLGVLIGKRPLKGIGYAEVQRPKLGKMTIVYDKQKQVAWLTVDLEDFKDEWKARYGSQNEHLYLVIPFDGKPPALKRPDGVLAGKIVARDDKVEAKAATASQAPAETAAPAGGISAGSEKAEPKSAHMPAAVAQQHSGELQVALGQPFECVNYSFSGEVMTRFTVIFDRIITSEANPYTAWCDRVIGSSPPRGGAPKGKIYIALYGRITNLGPQAGKPHIQVQVISDRGYAYDLLGFLTPERSGLFEEWEQGKQRAGLFYGMTPADASPTEIRGFAGGDGFGPSISAGRCIKFRLSLKNVPLESGDRAPSPSAESRKAEEERSVAFGKLMGRLKQAQELAHKRDYETALALLGNIGQEDRKTLSSAGESVAQMEADFRARQESSRSEPRHLRQQPDSVPWQSYEEPAFDALIEQAGKLPTETSKSKAQAVTPRMLFTDSSSYAGRLVTISGVLTKINIVRAPARLASMGIDYLYECYVRDAQDEAGPTAIAVVIDNPAVQERLTDAIQVTGFFYRLRPFSEPQNTGYRPVLVARRLEPGHESPGPARPATPAAPAARPAKKPAEAPAPRPSQRLEPATPAATWGFERPVKDEPNLTWGITQAFAALNPDIGGFHSGEDWNLPGAADLGKPVYAVAEGQVVMVSELKGNRGHLIALRHTAPPGRRFLIPTKRGGVGGQEFTYAEGRLETVYSVYVHVAPAAGIVAGKSVERGEVIATVADITPLSPHLHFEIRDPSMRPSADWSMVYDVPTPGKKAGTDGSGNVIPRSVRDVGGWIKFAEGIAATRSGSERPSGQVTDGTANWVRMNGVTTGYYSNLQEMVNAGLREPLSFLRANAAPTTGKSTSAPAP